MSTRYPEIWPSTQQGNWRTLASVINQLSKWKRRNQNWTKSHSNSKPSRQTANPAGCAATFWKPKAADWIEKDLMNKWLSQNMLSISFQPVQKADGASKFAYPLISSPSPAAVLSKHFHLKQLLADKTISQVSRSFKTILPVHQLDCVLHWRTAQKHTVRCRRSTWT